MPVYLARGPATFALLIRARDRDHLNYIIDAAFDPGLFEVEVYDGPLSLKLSLPAELDDDDADADADLKVCFTGSTKREDLLALPTINPFDELGDLWGPLRERAFPCFTAAVESFAEETEEAAEAVKSVEAPRERLEQAIAADIIEQGRRLVREQQPAEGEEAARRQMLDVTVPVDSLLAGFAGVAAIAGILGIIYASGDVVPLSLSGRSSRRRRAVDRDEVGDFG
jgi:hypothetical protein